MNRVMLIGRMTRDPELAYTKQNAPYVKMRIAVMRGFRNRDGEREADFVDCTVWNKSAEHVAAYCRRGSLIGVTGSIRTSRYDNAEGKRIYRTEVLAQSITFLERRQEQARQ